MHLPLSFIFLQNSDTFSELIILTSSNLHSHLFPTMFATWMSASVFFSLIDFSVSMTILCCICLGVKKTTVLPFSAAYLTAGASADTVLPIPVGAWTARFFSSLSAFESMSMNLSWPSLLVPNGKKLCIENIYKENDLNVLNNCRNISPVWHNYNSIIESIVYSSVPDGLYLSYNSVPFFTISTPFLNSTPFTLPLNCSTVRSIISPSGQ